MPSPDGVHDRDRWLKDKNLGGGLHRLLIRVVDRRRRLFPYFLDATELMHSLWLDI